MKRPSIFITGAAAGIGRAAALHFSRQGWFVGAFDVDEVGLAGLKAELGECVTGKLDVCDYTAWEMALESFFVAAGGRLDVLLNNAGILASGPYENTPIERHHLIVDINIKGVMNGCHAALPWLQRTPRSRVINMASASAIYGQPSLATYSATKFAVRGLTEALDLEWQQFGIRVMSVWPLFVQTAMVDGMDAKSISALGVKLTAQDVANVIWQAAMHDGRPKVHWPVGLQSKLFQQTSKYSPEWLNRFINFHIAARH